MEFFEVVQQRHSIRAFTAHTITPAQRDAILDAANRAPSAGNLQAYEIFAVTDHAILHALADAALGQAFIADAPLALVFCANPARARKKYLARGEVLYCIQDATIACAYAQLAVTALGLASVWVGAFNEGGVLDALGADSDLVPVAILPIGYAGEAPRETSRRAVSDVVKDR